MLCHSSSDVPYQNPLIPRPISPGISSSEHHSTRSSPSLLILGGTVLDILNLSGKTYPTTQLNEKISLAAIISSFECRLPVSFLSLSIVAPFFPGPCRRIGYVQSTVLARRFFLAFAELVSFDEDGFIASQIQDKSAVHIRL